MSACDLLGKVLLSFAASRQDVISGDYQTIPFEEIWHARRCSFENLPSKFLADGGHISLLDVHVLN